jgi:hypothetical protein
MRTGFLAAVGTVFAAAAVTAAEPEKTSIELNSALLVAGLPMAESEKPVHRIHLTAQVDKKGEGSGTLELDPNEPTYDELGFETTGRRLAPVKLECTLKLVKKKKIQMPQSPRIAAPLVDVEYVLLRLHGPRITGRLFLSTEDRTWGSWARLLIHDKDGKVRQAVHLTAPPPPEPCHPGCFPAGTPVQTPDGSRRIETLRDGEVVTTLGQDGKAKAGKVVAVFVTRNRLVEVQTEDGKLVTTQTQPLALAAGGVRGAGNLKPGDRVLRWESGQRRTVMVRAVSVLDRLERVFNLILGDPTLFVAGGFLVRSKPPVSPELP